MKFFVVLVCFIASTMAQRGSYAGSSPKGTPDVHPRFRQNNTSSQIGTNVGNRLGETDTSSIRIPVDARGDSNLVNRLNEWPKENRPFWLVNADIIERQRGGQVANGVSQPEADQNSNSQGLPNSQQNNSTNQIQSRFGGDNNESANTNESFSTVINGQWKKYVYDSQSDSWIRRA